MSPEIQNDVGNSCAGRPIKSSMHPFSVDFLEGCKKFSELVKSSSHDQETRVFNTSCIINAACFLEAKINEEISIGVICFDETEAEGKSWRMIQDLQKKLTVQEKWDLVAAKHCSLFWDKGIEPFQSFEVISSLRNELVHYKGSFLPRDETPNKKITGLMNELGVSSKTTWIEDDCSSWVSDLLSSKKLASWVFSKIKRFSDSYHELRKPKT